MGKKFDVVIGNPPYQEEAQGDATNQMPIYHLFMDAAYAAGDKAVLITPARFLFNAGYTPKAWNAKMLADPHLAVPIYEPNSDHLFPGTDIKGGVAVTYRDPAKNPGPIGTFTKYPELNVIMHKVQETGSSPLTEIGITNDRVYRYTPALHDEHPELSDLMSAGNHFKLDSRAFTRLASIYFADKPDDGHEYVRVLGLDDKKKRSFRWIRSAYLTGPVALRKYKVALPKANGSGSFGEALASTEVLEPEVGVTGTFITIGAFDSVDQANACAKYLYTKFARALLGVLKVTQDNLARVWTYVPLQDFTETSDIDWSKSIPEIDQQLYVKYGLAQAEIDFIESHVKPMS
jgi:hypothetical protein